MPKKLKVTRVLVYEGYSDWIDMTLNRCFVLTGKPFVCPGGRIDQTDLKIKEVKKEKEEEDGREENDNLSDNP